VTLVLSSADFPHGFSIPDFGVRVDLVPGKTMELTFTPDRAGRFAFLCDNFCGEGHDGMTGMVVVTES
jgi:cytochrome c oxidase subunit 2